MRNRRLLFNLTAGVATILLLGCPIRNLQSLRECLGMPDVVMDVPAPQVRFEAGLLMLQVCLAALAGLALHLGSRRRPILRVGAGLAWTLVALGGFLWDKALGSFVGEALPANSAFGCLFSTDGRRTPTAC